MLKFNVLSALCFTILIGSFSCDREETNSSSIFSAQESPSNSTLFSLPPGANIIFSKNYLNARERFLDKFYFEGHVAEFRKEDEKIIKFADQTIHLATAIINFSAEAKILHNSNLSTKKTDQIINELLATFLKLQELSLQEEIFGASSEGFFIRDSISDVNRSGIAQEYTILSDFKSATNDLDKKYMAAMSNDQVLHVLVALWSIVDWSNDSQNQQLAIESCRKIMNYLVNHKYVITLPDGTAIEDRRGPDMRISSLMAAKIADFTTGDNYYNNSEVSIGSFDLKLPELRRAFPSYDNFFHSLVNDDKIEFSILGQVIKKIKVKDYSRNLVFLSFFLEKNLSTSEYIRTAFESGHYWGLLMRLSESGEKLESYLNKSQIQSILDLHHSYPQDGSSNLASKGRWSNVIAWARDGVNDDDGHETYNGLDFMVFENMLILNNQPIGVPHPSLDEIETFITNVLNKPFDENTKKQILVRLSERSWNQLKQELTKERVINIYKDILGADFQPTHDQIVEGTSFKGRFNELADHVTSMRAALIVIVVNNILF